MLKAVGKMMDGRPLLILGLAGETITRLIANEPVSVNVGELDGGLPELEVIVLYGATEADIALELAKVGLMGPGTKVHDVEEH